LIKCRQFWKEYAVSGYCIKDDLMDRQVKAKLLVLHTYQQRAEQGTVFQVEWTPRILCCQTCRFPLAFWLRKLA